MEMSFQNSFASGWMRETINIQRRKIWIEHIVNCYFKKLTLTSECLSIPDIHNNQIDLHHIAWERRLCFLNDQKRQSPTLNRRYREGLVKY